MKKLLISLCCIIALIGITGCNNNNTTKENNNKNAITEENNSKEEAKADINNLFSDIQEIESIQTMRIDIQYTLDTKNQIKYSNRKTTIS